MGPGVLSEILENLPNVHDPKLIVGFDTSDDACVYRLTDEIAAIHTVDFFTPIVDDPYWFGQIAAATALRDVYAMGGSPAGAMTLLGVPTCLSLQTTRKILGGGHDKAVEAGCVIAGGHTIQDPEPKYGLCVTGYVHPDKVLRNAGARPGDALVLTKAIGTGVITTGAKADLVEEADYRATMESMATLNAAPAKVMLDFDCVHACTDITGFCLLGHADEMAVGSGATIRLESGALPLLPGALDLAEMGIIPSGAYRHMDYVKPRLHVEPTALQARVDLIADPQTSGGLLIALPRPQAEELVERLRPTAPVSCIVGTVLEKKDWSVEIV